MNIVFYNPQNSDDEKIVKRVQKSSFVYFDTCNDCNEMEKMLRIVDSSYHNIIIIDDYVCNPIKSESILDQLKSDKFIFHSVCITADKHRAKVFQEHFDQVIVDVLNESSLKRLLREAAERTRSCEEEKEIFKDFQGEIFDSSDSKLNKAMDVESTLKILQNKNLSLNDRQKYYSQLKEFIIYPGEVILKNYSSLKAMDFSEEYFSIDEELNCIISKRLGFYSCKEGEIIFHPILEITEDAMQANSLLFPLPDIALSNAINFFYEEITLMGIKKGIEYEILHSSLQELYENNSIGWFTIANGSKPVHGYNQYVEFVKEVERYPGKIVDSLGRMDFREHAELLQVKKGEAIARLIPELKAKDGFSVKGTILAAKNAYKSPLKIGKNLTFNEKTLFYESDIDGLVIMKPKTLSVEGVYVISGDVNMETGNIHYKQNIWVKGNIESGMQVECGGNLIVEGIIGDASVLVLGDLIVKGIIGCLSSSIMIHGRANIGFIENSSIDCLKDVVIQKHSLNGTIRSTGKIFSKNNCKIIGGHLVSSVGMELYSLGNEEEVPVVLHLGMNFYVEGKLQKISSAMKVLKSKMEESMEAISEYIDLKRNVNEQLKKLESTLAKTLLKKFSLLRELREKEKKFNQLYEELARSMSEEFSSYLEVRNVLYPNVHISIIGISEKNQFARKGIIYILEKETYELKSYSIEEKK